MLLRLRARLACWAALLAVGGGFTPLGARRGSLIVRRAAVRAADFPPRVTVVEKRVECWNPPCKEQIPDRWRKVHDCDRPAKWRELLDDEDCRIFNAHRDEFEDGPGAAVAIAERAAAEASERVDVEGAARGSTSRKYQDLVPTLVTMDDFLDVNAAADKAGRLVIVKFYSNKCRACLRIAAKYRRLALDLKESVDCYEAELSASQSLLERLDVTQVPSIQIFDGNDITRLAMYSCKPADWKVVDAKVRIAMVSMQRRRGLHKLFGEPLLDILTVPILGL